MLEGGRHPKLCVWEEALNNRGLVTNTDTCPSLKQISEKIHFIYLKVRLTERERQGCWVVADGAMNLASTC